MNMEVQICLQYLDLNSNAFIFRREIAVFYSSSMPSFLRKYYIVFHNGENSLHSHSRVQEIDSFQLHSFQYLLYFVFLIIANLTGVRQNFIIILICISVVISDVEHISYTYWPFLFLLWRNVYVDLFRICKLHSFLRFGCLVL